MDLVKTGRLIAALRNEKKMTQKELSEKVGVCAKTVSKWETGHGFPDVSIIPYLSDALGVDISKLIAGEIPDVKSEAGNVRRMKFYVCPKCGNVLQSMGNAEIMCCGRKLTELKSVKCDAMHQISTEKIEDDYFITFSHPMTKEHHISFVSYVRFDRILTVKLYPEQDGTVRFSAMGGGKLYFYCTNHGLFEFIL